MRYVDGFVLPVKTKKLKAYLAMAKKAGKIWMDHGALQYCESLGDDMNPQFGLPFPKLMKLKADETAVFSWIVYKSRKHRDQVNAAIMQDPRMAKIVAGMKEMPFDMKRMAYGGFQLAVDHY